MRPKTVEIKVTVAGDHVEHAISRLALTDGDLWTIMFCEDVTVGAASTPLLDLGVILRARRKSGTRGDSTVKLRPCRWSQLDKQYFGNAKDDGTELKIEPDWAGSGRHLAASMTAQWSDGRIAKVQAGSEPPAALFTDRQRDFLALCGTGRVNLSALTALQTFAAIRWKEFPASANGVSVSVRAERWTIEGGDDFLELSIVSTVEEATADQAALRNFVETRGLTVDDSSDNKTKRVLTTLVARLDA